MDALFQPAADALGASVGQLKVRRLVLWLQRYHTEA